MQDASNLIHVREGGIVLDPASYFRDYRLTCSTALKSKWTEFPEESKEALISRILTEEFTARAGFHTDASQYVLSVTLG